MSVHTDVQTWVKLNGGHTDVQTWVKLNGGHTDVQTWVKLNAHKNFVDDHPMNIHTKFGSNWLGYSEKEIEK
jgi:hypothetical protein